MRVEKIRLGNNEDGSAHYLYRGVDDNGVVVPDAHIVITGPVTGEVTTADGTVVDVTPFAVAVSTPAEALAISDAIGAQHETEGHPSHDPDQPFVATPSALSHNPDGSPSEKFTAVLEDLAPANRRYDGPQSVIDKLSKSGG